MLWIVFDLCYYITLALVPIIVFVYFSKDDNFHSSGGILYFIKYFFGRRAIKNEQKKIKKSKKYKNFTSIEEAKFISNEFKSDNISFFNLDQNGNQLIIKLTLRANYIAELILCLRINGFVYILPNDEYSSNEYKIWTKSINNYNWKCRGLNIETLEPFKRFRLSFNGFLMNISPQKNGNIEHIKFNFIWNCCSKPNISLLDDDLDLLTHCLAKTKWQHGKWLNLLGDEKSYTQFGALKGLVSGDNINETELNMSSVRKRYWGYLESDNLNKYSTIFLATENGYMLHFGIKSVIDGCQDLRFGHTLMTSGKLTPLQSTDLQIKTLDQNVSDKLTIHVKAGGKILKIIFSLNKNNCVNFLNNNFRGFKINNCSSECTLNGNKGFAIMENWKFYKGCGVKIPTPILKEITDENRPEIYTTIIGSEESKCLGLTGGKGCSLGNMKSLLYDEINIPGGFIITTHAYNEQFDNNFEIKKTLLILEDIALGRENGNLENACDITVKCFEKQEILPIIQENILNELAKFKKDDNTSYLKWAVRSSGICEDSEEFSSAGQNATYLGCQNMSKIIENIKKCWASLYTYQSVTYRRQHALPIRTSMAVVIQKMIPADSAGVLFTCNPSTSNPSEIIITSNFGLGETVVSGTSEPDTIVLKKKFNGHVSFKLSTIGTKNNSIIINKFGSQKTILNDEEKSKKLSLSEENSIKLGKIGVILENVYGSPRDIEWAIADEKIFILQSRPVTTLNQWTDYELLHEFDTPHISNDTYYTRGNIGEVSPFALTPLTQSAVMESLEKGYQIRMFGKYDPFTSRTIVFNHHFCMIELLAGFYARPRKTIEIAMKMVDIAIFGRPVLDEELNKKAIERYGLFSDYEKMKEILFMLKLLWQSQSILKKLIYITEKKNIVIGKTDTIIDIYDKIEKFVNDFINIANIHCLISMVSVIYQTFTMVTLMEGEKEITTSHYSDLAKILSSCQDVISAEVPKRLEKIAEILKNSKKSDEFINIQPDKGMEWIRNNCREAYEHLEDFLNVHGHRLLGEFELSLDSWEMNPEYVIKMIQINCKFGAGLKKQTDNNSDIVEELECTKKPLTKKILRFLMNKQRKAVGNREISKSACVKAVNKLRIAYRILAKKMVENGMIPSENLIYHLTKYEIWQIINKKNLNLIPKAIRRQKLYPIWNKFKFPEIMYGIPEPEKEEIFDKTNVKLICKGTPVCVGNTKGRACVITTLDEIKVLKEGDILITHSTDIGWSPYFPIISGIVTELGGIVSHGAVVAREYGIPCIVGAKNATKLFKTGDEVYLSGTEGLIKLIEN